MGFPELGSDDPSTVLRRLCVSALSGIGAHGILRMMDIPTASSATASVVVGISVVIVMGGNDST